MDAREGVVEHDLNLLGFVLETGRATVIALNKWDGMEQGEKDYVKTELERRLFFVDYADIHFISAKHGTGVRAPLQVGAGRVQVGDHPLADQPPDADPRGRRARAWPPMVSSRRIKLRYAHLGGANPPLIVIHGNGRCGAQVLHALRRTPIGVY